MSTGTSGNPNPSDPRVRAEAYMSLRPKSARTSAGWKAEFLQREMMYAEDDQLEKGVDYSDRHARLATVHARQDIILIVSYLSSIAESARRIASWITVLGWIAVIGLLYYFIAPSMRARAWIP